MQMAVIESARNLAGVTNAGSEEFDVEAGAKRFTPVVYHLKEWVQGNHVVARKLGDDKGGTMRLGAYSATLREGSRVAQIYGTTAIEERHRHRYEVDIKYREKLEACGLMFSGMSNVIAFVKDGKLRVYGVSTPKRSTAMPDAPTIAEAGLPGYGYAAWNGIVAPAATPPEVVRKLHSEFAKAIANPALRAKLASLGFDLVGAGPEEFGNLIKTDVARMGTLVRAAGIQAN
jgi:hypothetical protein